jgi:hypothetical protein
MAQDEQNVDTPEQQGSNLSVEEAFFSNNDEGSTTQTQETTDVVQGVVNEDVSTPAEAPNQGNDERRYQYWQSEADKQKNENEALKQQLQQTQAMQAQMFQQQQANQQQAPVSEPQAEQFPLPPERPAKPAGFNRGEAFDDPNSPSARYLDEVEAWRDNMAEYTQLKTEYDSAIVKEKIEKQEARRVENIKRAQAQRQMNEQVNQIYNQVQGEYGLNPEEAKSFVNDMSKPDSLSMDNLVELWRMKNGSGASVNQQPMQPSEAFTQQQRAQQVASPMGVLPAQQSENTQSTEDSIMDSMISGYKKNNPW